MNQNKSKQQGEETIVLAFSGGLDTCYCLWYLVEQGYKVHTVFVATGGISQAEEDNVASRAKTLGAIEHHVFNVEQALWDEFVTPLLWSNAKVLNAYPLLCSDRYLIVQSCLALCDELETTLFAHGCTGMGNDQMRFDQTVRSLGDYDIIAPIRDLQSHVSAVREYELEKLKTTDVDINLASKKYSINENLLGVTISGSEIDEFAAPDEHVFQWCQPRSKWPVGKIKVNIEFNQGAATHLNGKALSGPQILAKLNQMFGAYGVGKHIYTGDVILGLKGRIAFECPGIDALLTAHKALNDAVNTKLQNQFHQTVAQRWAELVYSGFFYDPHKPDLEAYLKSSQQFVTGSVTLESDGGSVHAVALESDNLLVDSNAVYAQQCDWSPEEAVGFIKLTGQSSSLASRVRSQSQNKGM